MAAYYKIISQFHEFVSGCRRGISGQLSKFTIDARDAGDGGLGFSVEGPSKAELNCIAKEDGTCQVEFLPKAPGVYWIHIKYADQHIPGSPFTCVVAGEDGTLPDEASKIYTR